MKDKLYDPARFNEKAPARGMAAVNSHSPEEEPETDRISKEKNEKSIQEDRSQTAFNPDRKQTED